MLEQQDFEYEYESGGEELAQLLPVAMKLLLLANKVFGNEQKASKWLHQPRNLFGGQSALTLMQSESGARTVEDTLLLLDQGFSGDPL